MELVRESPVERLIALISPLLAPLGYEIVHLEAQTNRQKTLRLFIDRVEGAAGGPIGVEDCVKATRALDEPLDQLAEVDAIFKGPYELEVSSPGIDRPLRTPRDYERFAGKEVRVNVYRPLSADEIGNAGYHRKNPKQKNFLGTLKGLRDGGVVVDVGPKAGGEIKIPLQLISKAHLEPKFEIPKEGVL